MAYLLAGGYALLHRRHVRIDVLYEALSPRTGARLDAVTFVFFVAYCLTLIWSAAIDAWNSFQIGETTGTPWNPVDLAGQGGDPGWPACCCCCRASRTSSATSAGRRAGVVAMSIESPQHPLRRRLRRSPC